MDLSVDEAFLSNFPPLSDICILHCSFSVWYARYRSITPKARIIKPLPPEFIAYLSQDSIVLPCGISDKDSDSSSISESADQIMDIPDNPVIAFQALDDEITRTIESLNGAVFPKLNWSSPKDAAWITSSRNLRCTTSSDIYLLFKSSDFIAHDLFHAFDDCISSPDVHVEYELVLKQWFTIIPSMEFRCFVKQRCLIGISQRDLKYYAFLESLRPIVISLAVDLFNSYLKDTFPDENFIFDIYIPPSKSRAWLIDINPWHYRTLSLLFSWKELLSDSLPFSNDSPQLRLVDADSKSWGPSQFVSQRFSEDIIHTDTSDFDIEKYIKKLQDMNTTTNATNNTIMTK
ncbi:hypothetical protein T552_04157 [Pneumocystis carinii B80]|uniref:Uncharacterized protein n=1 Tax=Pneumocystis carinii (strain B80) TaxID=1408658 RepID=A0A0W4ZG50_PNEC8|nr:hypothetical protein T552_04157 [Pneumocystis carinii B80]KTW27349.1 hypothetical protein T552_04157 [Pneumocystis carinii B80]